MTFGVRRSSRNRQGSGSAGPSGSEYHESDKSMEAPDVVGQDEPPPATVEYVTSRRGRKVLKTHYGESEDDEAMNLFADDDNIVTSKRSSRHSHDADEEEDDVGPRRYRSRNRKNSFIATDDDEDAKVNTRYNTRHQAKILERTKPRPTSQSAGSRPGNKELSQRARRLLRRNQRTQKEEEDYIHHTSSGASADADGSIDDAPLTSSDPEPEQEPEREQEQEQEVDGDGKPYALRQRQKINYFIPPPLEEMPRPPPPKSNGGLRNAGKSGLHGPKRRTLGWSASGAELGRWMGMGGDDSDSDHGTTRTPRKPFGAGGAFGAMAGAAGASGLLGDLAAGGTPSNLGKIGGEAALADADPLGVNINVTFDEVGGLDEHIHALKEMTLLPLLYPEVFQKFNVTPPRGVLFHGPPGTGKTLLARALAASCRSDGRSISFFMRKGADCLSKWVGEAERQLRLLFEEARASQPSIIFFDEIDGLAPVRSAKQDQIHASIVSTLLALMDGMDGRGQVIVIGATNRPDAVDPALRRPGRFDREFYFGLPGLEAREKILGIMTKGWVGWGEDVKESEAPDAKAKWAPTEKLKGLAKLTKGYGGADLRALCTEAALNAVQRRYPQIYKSNERLLLKPETIGVGLRDFMISIKKLVPSSARSSSSAATPLPPQFEPLLNNALEQAKTVVSRVIPTEKRLTALEEAMYEDNDGEEGALEKELLMQSMQTLRVYRPRVIIHGSIGMGQEYVGAAVLHHLEGYYVQTLELGTLMSDSTRTIEAAIVQLFVEAKRRQPSVIYIPSLVGWCATVSETSRSIVRAMLDTLLPTDPILLLVVVDGHFADLPVDVKAWFGLTRDNRIEITSPSSAQRAEFFEPLIKDVQRPPNQFADGVKRKLRILEELPVAPPLEPRQPTAAELALQQENDQRVITLLKFRLGPILTELKRKFKRFTKRATEEYNFEEEIFYQPPPIPAVAVDGPLQDAVHPVDGPVDVTQTASYQADGVTPEHALASGLPNGIIHYEEVRQQEQARLQEVITVQLPQLFDIDLEKMHSDLFKGRYLTPQDFLDDIGKMVHNAQARAHEDSDRLYKAQAMFTAAEVSILEFDQQFKLECERMAVREHKRREELRIEKGKEKNKNTGETNGQPNGTRRSARNNGQQPELGITDPVLLERRLKRQRSNAPSDSHTSSASEDDNRESRDAKRSRMAEPSSEPDPLDIVSPTPVQPRVHFEQNTPYDTESMPQLNGFVSGEHDAAMIVDSPTPVLARPGGFDPSLLNPLPSHPDANPFYGNSSLPHTPEAGPSRPTIASETSSNIFALLTPSPVPAPLSTASPPRTPSAQRSRTRTKSPVDLAVNIVTASSPVTMVIERTPTPLPDFHVDDILVTNLQHQLRDETEGFTIEELEQLRAICLGCVWRHRTEWDRDALVRELQETVKEFATEVNLSQ